MIKKITLDELKDMDNKEGLIIQGCGGDLKEWEEGINELLTEVNILLEGDKFKNVYAFENEGLTNLLFDMEDVKLNIGKLAIWRLQTRETFGSTWLSDYRVNNLNIEENFEEPQL